MNKFNKYPTVTIYREDFKTIKDTICGEYKEINTFDCLLAQFGINETENIDEIEINTLSGEINFN